MTNEAQDQRHYYRDNYKKCQYFRRESSKGTGPINQGQILKPRSLILILNINKSHNNYVIAINLTPANNFYFTFIHFCLSSPFSSIDDETFVWFLFGWNGILSLIYEWHLAK